MQMPNVRRIWHLQAQSALHQRIVNLGIANFFAILLQYNSKGRIHCSSILIYIYISWCLFPPKFLSYLSHYFCSLLSLPSLFLHLLSHLWSFIAEISHPSLKFLTNLWSFISKISHQSPKFLTHLRKFLIHLHRWSFTRPLSHLSL